MNEKEFSKLCKELVMQYANEHIAKTDKKQITEDDVFVVWMCKTLQNIKALANTTLPYGITYNTGNIVGELNERAQFGNYAIVPRSDGSLKFLKVGG